jgi:hypothetical protein
MLRFKAFLSRILIILSALSFLESGEASTSVFLVLLALWLDQAELP